MINVSQEWKENVYTGAEKKIKIAVGNVELTDDDIQGKVEIQETCTNSEDIKIGSCIASILKFNLTNKGQNIDFLNNDISVQVGIKIPSTCEFEFVPMGIFTFDNIDDKDERVFKITARDRMKLFDKDCTEFLKTRAYPITLWTLTQQLSNYVGVELENTSIVNGNYAIEENFSVENITGQQILSWIGEVSASFINFNRYGKLVFKTFTSITNNVTDKDYINIDIAKYTVPQITRLQIAVQENDLGVIVGSGNITYSIINNPLLYTKSGEQIIQVANNILAQLQILPSYAPVKAYGKGNPAIETGDIFKINTLKGQQINVFVMDRKFVYQKSFRDTYQSFGTSAVGEKRIVQSSTLQLKGKMNILTRTLEENRLKVADLETGYNEIVQTVDELSIEVAEIDLKSIATYYQMETPTHELKIGDIWYNPGYNYIVDNLTMAVNEMTMTVDELIFLYSKLRRWNGATWEEIKDTENIKNISELSVRSGEIELRVSSAEGNIGNLQLTSSDLTARISSAEGNIGQLELTSTELTTRIENTEGDIGELQLSANSFGVRLANAEGNIASIDLNLDGLSTRVTNAEGNASSAIQKADAIELAVNNTKVTIDSVNGVIIQNGGFKITGSYGDTFTVNSSTGATNIFGNLKTGSGNKRNEIANGVVDFYAENSSPQSGGYKCGSIYGYYYRWGVNPYTASLILNGNTEVAMKIDVSGSPEYHLTSSAHQFTGNIVAFGKTFTKTKAGNSLTSTDHVMVAN